MKLGDIQRSMNFVEQQRPAAASFHKVFMHVHTPASHDYLTLSEEPHNEQKAFNWTEEELFEYGVQHGYWDSGFQIEGDLDSEFDSREEHISFLLLVSKMKASADGFVITDHNTFAGYPKACVALQELKAKNCNSSVNIIRGIEVTCADSIHVVGIFDKSSKIDQFQEWFDKNLVSVEEGTFQTSIAVLEKIVECNGIAYPAHLNTAPLFGKDNAYSQGYKQRLLTLDSITVYGIKDIGSVASLEPRLQQCTSDFNLSPMLEDDSHSVPELGSRYVWIKCKTVNAIAIRNAFRSPGTLILNQVEKPTVPRNQIVSLFVGGEGFLGNGMPQTIRFADGLTSLIGGRGVGKSTILKCLSLLSTGRVDDVKILEHVINQGSLCLHARNEGRDYYVTFLNPDAGTGEGDKSFLSEYAATSSGKWRIASETAIKRERFRIIMKRLQVFEGSLSLEHEVTGVEKLRDVLGNITVQAYQAGTLINSASSNLISGFVRSNIEQNNHYLWKRKRRTFPNELTSQFMDEKIKSLAISYHQRETQLERLIQRFNSKEAGKLRLTMSPRKELDFEQQEVFWLKVLDFINLGERNLDNSFGEWKISRRSVLDLVMSLSGSFGVLQTISVFLNDDLKKIHPFLITALPEADDIRWVDKNDVMNKENEFVYQISHQINNNIGIVQMYFEERLNQIDNFMLEFNVVNTSYGEKIKKEQYHAVDNLSMGQTVVAMLSFVLSMGDLVGVNNPILLDQPEDNLDSQYVYYNLVKDLIGLKAHRQVILATHNSTIVVNAGSELVVSLYSEDGIHGWIRKQGYTAEPPILTEIITVMEGGM